MTNSGFALFDTAIGACGIAWSEAGLTGLQLPEADRGGTRRRLAKRFPQAVEATPPPEVLRAIDLIRTLLAGDDADLSDIRLDMERVPDFNRKVYAIARAVPPGATLTYGEIAARLGDRLLAQDVGKAMGQNPFPIVVPCHRVLAAGGRIGGFSANGGIKTKRKLLAIESAHAKGEPTLFDSGSPGAP
jgi:methylated-DNA-[protein]-cysteine S-methyltransferase